MSMKYSLIFALPLLLLFSLCSTPVQVFAQADATTPPPSADANTPPDVNFRIDNPLRYNTLDEFITAIMGLVLQIMTPVIAILIIWTGFLFVKARGNPAEITKAKQAFLWVIIGAAIMLGAFVLKSAIEGTVGQLKVSSSVLSLLVYV